MGVDWVAKQRALQNWVVACTGLPATHVIWGQQYAPRPTQSSIVMKLAIIQSDGVGWLDMEANPLTFAAFAVTSVDATDNEFVKTGHGLLTGDGPVWLDSDALDLPANIEPETNYWVIKVDNNTFKLASNYVNAINGLAIDLGDTGSGVITVDYTASSLRTGQELTAKSRNLIKAMLSLECYADTGVGADMAAAILWRIQSKRRLPTPAAILETANIAISEVGAVKAIGGTQDLVLLEPRALVDIMIHLVSEDEENIGIIERTEITNEDIPETFTVDGAE